MPLSVLKDIQKIYSGLNAGAVREASRRELRIGLLATSEDVYRDMEDFLVSPDAEPQRRAQVLRMLTRLDAPREDFDFFLCEQGVGLPRKGYLFDPANWLPPLFRETTRSNSPWRAPSPCFAKPSPAASSPAYRVKTP